MSTHNGAETFLEDAVRYSQVRGIDGYTGTWRQLLPPTPGAHRPDGEGGVLAIEREPARSTPGPSSTAAGH
jgi:hypothetical protein